MNYQALPRFAGLVFIIASQFGCTTSAPVSSATVKAPVSGTAQCTESANFAVSAAELRDSGQSQEAAFAQLAHSQPGDMLQSGVNSAYYFKDLAGYPLFSVENLFCLLDTNNPNGIPEFQVLLFRAHIKQAVVCQNQGHVEREAFLACVNSTQHNP